MINGKWLFITKQMVFCVLFEICSGEWGKIIENLKKCEGLITLSTLPTGTIQQMTCFLMSYNSVLVHIC